MLSPILSLSRTRSAARRMAIGVAAITFLVGGCAITFDDRPAPSSTETGGGAAASSSASSIPGGSGGTAGQGGGSGGTATDGGQGGTGGGCCECCDCDRDGQVAVACGGTDCADFDKNAFAGQTKSFAVPIQGHRDAVDAYDFNCDGHENYAFTAVVACFAGVTCDGTEKWTATVPKCGESADTSNCVPSGFLQCAPQRVGTRQQLCN